MNEPKDYRYIKAWGRMMGSFAYYIRDEQAKASKDNAPLDAIYYKSEDGWHVYSEVTNQETRRAMEYYLTYMDRK